MPNALVAFGIGNIQHNVTLCHADEDKTVLPIVFTIVKALNGKRVVENRFRQLEAYAMSL